MCFVSCVCLVGGWSEGDGPARDALPGPVSVTHSFCHELPDLVQGYVQEGFAVAESQGSVWPGPEAADPDGLPHDGVEVGGEEHAVEVDQGPHDRCRLWQFS